MAEMKALHQAGKLERTLGALLRSGVLVSAVVVSFGAILFLVRHGMDLPHFTDFMGQPPALRTVETITAMAFRLDPLAIIQFGLLLLIATPVARVVFSFLGFVMQRDWLYVGITALVLGLLLFGLFGGGGT